MTAHSEKILVPLAPGFEEIEVCAIVDVLRRADLDVTLAGTRPGTIVGAHGIAIVPDAHLGDLDLERFTMLVVPGGQPGTSNLVADERVLALARRLHAQGRRTAAICAAPLVLHAAGVLRGVRATAYPSVRKDLVDARVDPQSRVVRDGTVTTSQGAGTAIEFALELVRQLRGDERADALARALIVRD